jgi:hypothetical protein
VIASTSAMDRRHLLRAAEIVVVGGLALSQGACASEPGIRCQMQTDVDSDAIAAFTPVGMPTVVAGAPANACDFQELGEGLPLFKVSTGPHAMGPNPMLLLFGFETFFPSPTDPNQTQEPNTLALKPEWIGDRIQDAQVNAAVDPTLPAAERMALANYPYVNGGAPPLLPADPSSTNRPYAYGSFDSVYPDANGICTATLTASDMDYPDIPAHSVIVSIPDDGSYVSGAPTCPGTQPDTPDTHVRYEWSNFRAIVTDQSLGLEAFADVSITRDGCQANYHVSMLSPRVECTALDNMGNPVVPAQPDPTLCNPNASQKNPFGSGIHPGIQVECDQVGDPASPDYECMPTKTAP